MSLNVYHLEVFYHVARRGSVSEAANEMGKEQPTISAQVAELEKSLGGARLFHRRPFRLTRAGRELYEEIRPFFSRLPEMEENARGGESIRIGASPVILRDHFAAIEKRVRVKFPRMRLFLKEGNEPQLAQDVQREELDLAITLNPEHAPPKVKVEQLGIRLEPVLVVRKSHPARSAREILETIPREPLIALPPEELLMRQFSLQLKKLGLAWRPSIEVTSMELIQHFVLAGYGVGLSVKRPDVTPPKVVRELPLIGFPSADLVLLYRDHGPMPLFEAFLAEIKRYAAGLKKDG